jgi:hypothetical protein
VLGEADRGRDLFAAAVQTGVEDGVIDDRGEVGGVAFHDGSFRRGSGDIARIQPHGGFDAPTSSKKPVS